MPLWRYHHYSVWLYLDSKLKVSAVAAESDIRPLLNGGDVGVCFGSRCGTSADKECLGLAWPSTANSFPFSTSLFPHCAPLFSEPGCGVSPAAYTEGPTRCETRETACDSLNVEATVSRAASPKGSACKSTNESKLHKLTASAIFSVHHFTRFCANLTSVKSTATTINHCH
jgi:hypothetical protein